MWRTYKVTCDGCGNNRPLHESCAREHNDGKKDPHEADHQLRKWRPSYRVSFSDFFAQQKHQEKRFRKFREGCIEAFGRDFKVDYAFNLESPHIQKLALIFFPHPGTYDLALDFHYKPSSKDEIRKGLDLIQRATKTFREVWDGVGGQLAKLYFRSTVVRRVNEKSISKLWEQRPEISTLSSKGSFEKGFDNLVTIGSVG